jgi:Xaa-Pro aminopeptidase
MPARPPADKRARLAADLRKEGLDAAVISDPASTAWLFNIRGDDVIRKPLALSQAILQGRHGDACSSTRPRSAPTCRPGSATRSARKARQALPAALATLSNKRVAVDPAQSSAWYFDALEAAGAEVVRMPDPVAMPRAAKNASRSRARPGAHVRDGAALAVSSTGWPPTPRPSCPTR